MSTKLDDFCRQAVLGVSVPPGDYEDGYTGATVDLVSADGGGFAVLQIGTLEPGATVTARIDESADGTAWAPISGAQLTAVNQPGAHAVGFVRTCRYVRCVLTPAGLASVCVTVGQQRKQL